MASARMSVGPTHRRGTGTGVKLTSSVSLSASQMGTASMAGPLSTFSFKPHILLSDITNDDKGRRAPLLDYSDLNERIEIFKELFNMHLDSTASEIEKNSQEHARSVGDEQRNVDLVKERIERQKDEQKSLYQTVAAERQAESSAQSQLALLQASRASLAQRLTEAETERDKLQATLKRKKDEYEGRKSRLAQQVRRNKPELQRFNEKLGCRVSAGNGNAGQDRSIIKFTFNLLDPNDWTYEANFVIDASRSQYKIISAKPALANEKLERMLADLNRSRALFTFIKRMRSAFKEQIEQDRLTQKATERS